MSDLFKKLNILIQAGINDVLDDAAKAVSSGIKNPIPPSRLGKGIETEVKYLREQVNKALDHEDVLQRRIAELQREVEDYDARADRELSNGNEAQARYLLERMYSTQKRIEMTEADLREHQAVTRDLMMRVNQLDATIAEARHAESKQVEQAADAPERPIEAAPPVMRQIRVEERPVSPPKPTPEPEPASIPVETEVSEEHEAVEVPVSNEEKSVAPEAKPESGVLDDEGLIKSSTPVGRSESVTEVEGDQRTDDPNKAMDQLKAFRDKTNRMMVDVLREARETVDRMDDLREAAEEVQQNSPVTEEVEAELSKDALEQDIARRLARLSTPPKKPSSDS